MNIYHGCLNHINYVNIVCLACWIAKIKEIFKNSLEKIKKFIL